MAHAAPASLDSAALSRRLGELAGDERQVQVAFLLHLDEYDRRRAWAEAGYPSLWEWCLRVLHLREGAAGRRIAAMRALRRFPSLAEPLRDGRVSLSTVAVLGPVLTEANCDAIVARAAFMTRAETEHLVASLQPRTAPREGLRLLSSVLQARETPPPQQEPTTSANPPDRGYRQDEDGVALAVMAPASPPPPPPRAALEPVDASTWSLRVTVDAELKEDLDQLRSLLAHKLPKGDLGAVVREAVRCALEHHGKRRGAVEPSRPRKSLAPARTASATPAQGQREPIPAAVRREVWKRDGGRCAWRAADGRRCDGTWKLELDHVIPVALGGRSTVDNLRLCCRTHNDLHAEHVFGREHMQQYRTDAERARPLTSAGGSTSGACGEEVAAPT